MEALMKDPAQKAVENAMKACVDDALADILPKAHYELEDKIRAAAQKVAIELASRARIELMDEEMLIRINFKDLKDWR